MHEIVFSKYHVSWSGIVCLIHMLCNYYNLLISYHFKLWIIYPNNWCLIYVCSDKTKINRCLCRRTHLFRDCRDLWWYVLFHSPLINVHFNVLFLHINFCHTLLQLGLQLYSINYKLLVEKYGAFTNTGSSMQGLGRQCLYNKSQDPI